MHPITETSIDLARDGNLDFYQKALNFSKKFIQKLMKPFSSEDVIEEFGKSNELAEEGRVWGAVFRTLSKEGLIVFEGYQTYRNPKGHNKPSRLWITKEFKEIRNLNIN